jgi:ATP-dependent HslUV protease ATP-binding subunit HslU
MDRLLKALVGESASEATRESFRQRVVENAMNEVEVEIEVEDAPQMRSTCPAAAHR